MQTFLPWPDYERSAQSLDRARLGKQRVETMQIMGSLVNGSRWQNHPAVTMWRGYECSLLRYQAAITDEWVGRGYKDTCWIKTLQLHTDTTCSLEDPWWLGELEFHLAMQSRLIQKLPEHYLPQFPDAPHTLPYLWPTDDHSFRVI